MTTTESEIEQVFQAIKAGDKEALASLLKQHPTVRNATNPEGISLLLFAIYNGKKDIADLLVQAGSKFDVFSAAAYGALTEIVNILQYEPGLLNAYSPDGWTPLHLASFFGNQMVVEYLVMSRADVGAVSKNNLKNQPLNAATASNHTDIVKVLVKRGADVNFAQHEGITPLHAAAHNGNEELVQILLAHGADPNAKDEKGETPIDKATQRGHVNIVSILRS
ncbi:MAG: ankyrin [Bacteroidetes bacterium]|nr:ankyrin [Bacteroidota bacterium]